jgi:hypothetical protein
MEDKMAKHCSVPDCTSTHYAKGHCELHWKRMRKYGSTDNPRPTFEERFWPKVDKSADCWIWTGALNDQGYGTTSIDGVHRYSHRASFEMANGPIPEGMFIDHICHTPACVRPEHLRAATSKQNMENLSGAKSTSKSGIRGVHRRDYGAWQVQVTHNRRVYNGGTFPNLADAEQAAIALRNRLYTHNNVDRAA